MKLWFDEDLSHTLVQVAADFGLLATCNRDRGALGKSDAELMPAVVGEDYVFVTDNRRDFRKRYEPCGGIHPGLVFVPGTGSRELQQQRTRRVITWILDEAVTRGIWLTSQQSTRLGDDRRADGIERGPARSRARRSG